MRIIKKIMIGLAVAAFFAVAATPALAVPKWQWCVKSISESECLKIGEGNAESTEIVETEEVTSSGELEIEDEKATGGAVAVKCKGSGAGWVDDPSGAGDDGVSAISNLSCTLVKAGQCKELVSVKPRNLPWGSRLAGKEKAVRDELVSGPKKEIGSGEPGWTVVCKTIIGEVTDTCEGTVSAKTTDNEAKGVVEEEFEAKSGKTTCTLGGAKAGNMRGSLTIKVKPPGITVSHTEQLFLEASLNTTFKGNFVFKNSGPGAWHPNFRKTKANESPSGGARIQLAKDDCYNRGAPMNGTCEIVMEIEPTMKGTYSLEEEIGAAPIIKTEVRTK